MTGEPDRQRDAGRPPAGPEQPTDDRPTYEQWPGEPTQPTDEQRPAEPAQPTAEPVPTSSDPRVADALSRLSEADQLPLAEQVAVYTDIHRRLAGVLADPDSQA